MTNQETITKYLSDMYALEKHVVQPLESQAKDADFAPYPEAQLLIQELLMSTQRTLVTLETLVVSMGGETGGGVKGVVSAAAGVAAAVINEVRTHAITKKLRDDKTALSLLATGYELLHTTGNALGFSEVAQFAQNRLTEVAKFIVELSHEIIPVAVKELATTNTVDASTIGTSQQNVRRAWSR